MNIFRIGGDLSHLVSFFFLLQTLYKGRSSIGISLKTQELYLLVFITRYLDLFTAWHSLYNTSMKIIYIGISALIVYGIRFVVSGWYGWLVVGQVLLTSQISANGLFLCLPCWSGQSHCFPSGTLPRAPLLMSTLSPSCRLFCSLPAPPPPPLSPPLS